jgi:PAS domain S-box-containing protein
LQTLAESDLRLLERLGAGLAIVDPAGKIVLWNDHAARMIGIPAPEALGTLWTDRLTLIRGDDTGGATLRQEIQRQGGWHGPLQVRIQDGKTTWLRAHIQQLSLPEFHGEPGVAVLFWDGEGSDRAASGPGPAPLPYRDLFLQSPEALFLTDLTTIIIDANDAAMALLRATSDELVGKALISFFVGVAEGEYERSRAELLAAGSIVRTLRIQPLTGDPFPAQLIISLGAPAAGLVLVRMRDHSEDERLDRMLTDLAVLTPRSETLLEVPDVAARAVEIVAATWGASASLALLDDADGFSLAAGSSTPEAIRATLGGVDPARSPLALLVREVQAPFQIDLGAANSPAWARHARAFGLASMRAIPLWHDDQRIGSMVLLWAGQPPNPLDTARMEQIGRQVGLAIGSTAARRKVRRDAELQRSLAGSARIGGVVVEQMSDAIVTTDAADRVTAVNPAGERLYGFSEEDALGSRLDEVIEQLRLDGSPLGTDAAAEAATVGFWHGRVVHRPLVGSLSGRNIVVDLSLTTFRDEQHQPAGVIVMSREVTTSARLESEALALSSLALATGRARTRREVAVAALERLCEATMADSAIIATWGDGGAITIEASRGLSRELLHIIRESRAPDLVAALERPGEIIALESLSSFSGNVDLAPLVSKAGLMTGFLVPLRSRDESVGFMALGARNPAWGRPSDAVIFQAAAQVVGALESVRLMERLESGLEQEQHLTAQLERLMSLTLLPHGDISEEATAQLLLERIVGALGAEGGFAVREEADRFSVVASFHMPAAMLTVAQSRPASSFPFWKRLLTDPSAGAYRERTAGTLSAEPDRQPMVDRGVTSHAVFPVREGDRLLGAFFCYFSSLSEPTYADDRNVEAVGRIISIAYSNVRMREGLAEAAEHERRLTAELRALQELTLRGASTDDLAQLAQETIEAVVVATGASGGGYILVDPSSAKVDPITWVGEPSRSWAAFTESPRVPGDWPPISELQTDQGVYLSQPDDSDQNAGTARAQAVLPLRVDDRLAGVLHLEWADRPLGQQFDVHFLEPIARICSISLANFRLRAELLHRAAAQRALGHRLDALDELTRIGEEASSFEELAHRTVSLVREALDARGVCYLLIEVGRHFDTQAAAGETGAFRLWLKGVPAKDTPGGSLLLSGASSVLGDFAAGQVDERVLPLAAASGFHSFGAIPIRAGEELAGALLCFFEQPVASLPLDEAALDSVARIIAIALANFRLRERLVSSEERYRTLFEESPDALLVSALDGTVLDANEAAVRLYHLRRDEMLGRYFGQFITADEREMARRRQVVWAQGRGTFQDCGRRTDGSEFPVEMEVRVVDLGGQRRFLHLIRDLSDQDRLQRELLQAQKMEALGQLVSGVAHELNNPLAAIIAFSQLMRSDERLPEDMRHDAGLLVQEADRTRRIVQNLLDFARARPPERRPTSIAALVQSVLELQAYALNANQIQVKVDIPANLPEVDLDRAQLQQVLLNLTINAIQAVKTPDRTTPAHLWISAAVVKARPSAGMAKGERPADEPPLVRITIRDDGPGVPESARARLFDPFFTTKQPGDGTGLGLSVSFGIVAAHNGHLWYEPGPRGVGSSFVIELPTSARNLETGQPPAKPAATASSRRAKPTSARATAAIKAIALAKVAASAKARVAASAKARVAAKATANKEAEKPIVGDLARPASADTRPAPPTAGLADAARPAEPQPDPSPRPPRVLALDDEPSIRSFLRKALAVAGMDCVPFPDGAQALDGVREAEFDVMLIDHRMAGMSGTEFYEAAVRVRPELARRAVFMSGDVLNPDLRGFATQRDIRLLAKPFDIDAVVQVVRDVLAATDRQAGTSADST